MPTPKKTEDKSKRIDKALSLIPPEQRLPAFYFLVLESIFFGFTFSNNEKVQLATIVAMVIISCVFFIGFFNINIKKTESKILIQILIILGVIFLSNQYLKYRTIDTYSGLPDPPPMIYDADPEDKIVPDQVQPKSATISAHMEKLYTDATSLYSQQTYADAMKLFRQFVFKNTTYDDNYWIARHRIGICLRRLRMQERALEVFHSLAFDLEPDNITPPSKAKILSNSYNQIAIIYDKLNNTEKSHRYLLLANKIQPNDTLYHLNLSIAYAKMVKENEAKKWFYRVRETSSSDKIKALINTEEKELLLNYPWFKKWYNS